MHDGVYWINIDYVFKGDRLTLVNQYILDGATEVDPKTYDAITSQTHEDAPEGASEQKQYRNTSDLSSGVQRANVSGSVPPTKFEAARSRFLLGATAFRTREMQKCASPFVEVRQIEFLARAPNYTYHEPTHISHQWTCERERFASQGAKRRGENTTHPLDPDKLTRWNRGSISSLQPKARTKPRFLG